MNAKKVIINHEKLGKIPLGSLSHNELCRAVLSLMSDVEKAHKILEALYEQHNKAVAENEAKE